MTEIYSQKRQWHSFFIYLTKQELNAFEVDLPHPQDSFPGTQLLENYPPPFMKYFIIPRWRVNYINMKDHSLLANLGKKIRELRLKKNMTQHKLAVHAGLEKARISKIESGKLNSTVNTLNKLSEALEVPIVDFFRD